MNLLKSVTWILGAIFLSLGIAGFFSGTNLLWFDVDPVQNILHLLSGVIALAAVVSGTAAARMYLLVFGGIFTLIAIAGFIQSDSVLSLFPVNMATNWLHAAIALLMLVTGFSRKKH